MIPRRQLLAPAVAILGLAGATSCDDLERMIEQPRYSTFEECEVCPAGTIMMAPPAGTVSRDHFIGPDGLTSGREGQGWVARIPVEVNRAVIERGRDRFDIFCATCHGHIGNGVSQVAENMTLRMPPSLIAPPYLDYPAGRLFEVVTDGFGLMRSYSSELPLGDRWAVVAYLQVLQLSQNLPLGELPAPLAKEAEPWLR